MTNIDFVKRENLRLSSKYSPGIVFEKNDLFESLPKPTPLSFSIIRMIYSATGSLGQALTELGIYFDKTIWEKEHFLETIFGDLLVNKKQEREIFTCRKKISKELHSLIKRKIIKTNLKNSFYKIFTKILESEKGIYSFLQNYKFVFLINYFFDEAYEEIKKLFKKNDIDFIMNLRIHDLEDSWEKDFGKNISRILADWSFRTKYDLELYCDDYITGKSEHSAQNLKDLTDFCQRTGEIKLKFIKNFLIWKEVSQDAKHLLSFVFNTLRQDLYKKSVELGLDEKKDICFLNIDELNSSSNEIEVLKQKIKRRKEQYQFFSKIKISNIFKIGEKVRNQINDKKIICGEKISPGFFTGLISRKPGKSKNFQVVYLVESITPDIVENIFGIGAIITEVGSGLSHGAIIAREYNIPTVRIEDALNIFNEGEKVTVDAEGGAVSR